MLTKLFFNPYYVKIYKNKFIVKNIIENNEITLTATQPFSTARLLVGEFNEAEKLLTKASNNYLNTHGFLLHLLLLYSQWKWQKEDYQA